MAANSTSTNIAHDLVDEILLRLPLKSIIRFKSVSRQWKSLIESQSFIERHQTNSRRKILLASDSGCSDGNSPPYIFPGEEEEEEEICYIHNCDASSISLTCDGLICIPRSDSIEVCNPASRESRRFPISEPLVWSSMPHTGTGRIPVISILHRQKLEDWELNVAKFPLTTRSSFGFGKDEVTGAYKVVELHAPSTSFLVGDCNVLDLKTGRWRHVSVVPYRIFFTERSVYVNGSVHWFTVDIWKRNASKIVAFDLHVEKFRVVSHPNQSLSSESDHYPHLSELLSLRNRLSVSEMRIIPDVQLSIWSMVDIEEERWVQMHCICLCELYQPRSSSVQLFTPLVISEKGYGVMIIWDYRGTLFKSYFFLHPNSGSGLMEGHIHEHDHMVQICGEVSLGETSLAGIKKTCGEAPCEFSDAKTSSMEAQERAASMRKLLIAVFLCAIFIAVEVVGGIKANSLAILTDAAHLLSDVAAFAISLFSLWASGWKANSQQSYGFFRIEILGALVSIQMIWLLAGILVYEAIVRLNNGGGEVEGSLMFAVSAVGLLVNIAMAILLGHDHGHSHSHDHDHGHGVTVTKHHHDQRHEESHLSEGLIEQKKQRNVNIQGAYLHVLGDSIQSVGVMIGGAIIWYKPEWKIIDLICTLVFSVIVLGTTIGMLRNILEVLMESTPREINATRLEKGLWEMEEVVAIHELHIWAITLGKFLLACHVKIRPEAEPDMVLDKIIDYIKSEHNISHVTIQIERQ